MVTAGYYYVTNEQVVTMEEFIEDWELNDAPDINDDPQWLVDRVNDDILPLFKLILKSLA